MKKVIISLLLIIINICVVFSQIITLTGPEEVCPGTGGNGPTYTYTATSTQVGCFAWGVLEDGQWSGMANIPCRCSGGSLGSTFSYEFNPSVGEATVRVSWVKKFSLFCVGGGEELTVNRRVFGPGEPYDADGGDLSICPGETKTIYIPGVPGSPNSEDNCFWHHQWDWIAPAGWKVNGQVGSYRTGATSVQVEAPTDLILGGGDNYEITVQSQPAWPYPTESGRFFFIGYSDDLAIAGPSTVCTSSTTFSLQNLPPGASVSWSVSPASLFAIDTGTGLSFTTGASNSSSRGQGVITATISGSCGNTQIQESVWVGKPQHTSNISGATQLTPGLQENYSVSVANGNPSNYQWIIPSGCSNGQCWQVVTGQGTRSPLIQAGKIGDNQRIECRVYNSCGGYDVRYKYVDVEDLGPCQGPQTLSVYPNPSQDGDITVQVDAPCTLSVDEGDEQQTNTNNRQSALFITKLDGQVIYERKGTGPRVVLRNLDLKPGIYIVDYLFREERFQERLVVE